MALSLDDIRILLSGRPLLAIDRCVAPGEILTVMGPSGSGKSTLFAFLAGFLDPAFTATGRIRLSGRDVTRAPPQERGIGLLFQDPLLFPHLSVAGNLRFGLSPAVSGRKARGEAVEAMLETIGLAGFGKRDPATLSGGQAARVALARALLAEPRALLLDEPFARLDRPLRDGLRAEVFGLVRARHLPAILVTHDAEDARAAGGPVATIGEPEIEAPQARAWGIGA